MAKPVIVSLVNNRDNLTCTAVLAAPPTGAIGFRASPIPEEVGSLLGAGSVEVISPTEYRLTPPPPETEGPYPTRLVYVRAEDDSGQSAPAAVWIGSLDEDDVVEVMEKLRDRIWNNKAGIEARLRVYYPQIELKQVIYGLFAQITEYPCIEIVQQELNEPFYMTAWTRRHEITAEICGYLAYDEPRSEEKLSAAFGRAVQRILNQRDYEQMRLASGIVLTGCQAQDLVFDRTFSNGRFFASWRMLWRGEYTAGAA